VGITLAIENSIPILCLSCAAGAPVGEQPAWNRSNHCSNGNNNKVYTTMYSIHPSYFLGLRTSLGFLLPCPICTIRILSAVCFERLDIRRGRLTTGRPSLPILTPGGAPFRPPAPISSSGVQSGSSQPPKILAVPPDLPSRTAFTAAFSDFFFR
jgi:hypothetical protein